MELSLPILQLTTLLSKVNNKLCFLDFPACAQLCLHYQPISYCSISDHSITINNQALLLFFYYFHVYKKHEAEPRLLVPRKWWLWLSYFMEVWFTMLFTARQNTYASENLGMIITWEQKKVTYNKF